MYYVSNIHKRISINIVDESDLLFTYKKALSRMII